MKSIYNFCTLNLLLIIAMIAFSSNTIRAQIFSSGFEAADPVFIYNSTANTAANITGVPRTGSKCGGLTTAGTTYDASIITGTALNFTACKIYTVNVYARVIDCTGLLKIMKSTTATNVAMKDATGSDIILTAGSNNVTSTAYALFTATFSPSSNETKYIGFQMTGTGGGPCASINMYIDDITITETTPAPPVGGTATPAVGSVACLGNTTITLSGSTGTIQWQSSIDGGTTWTNILGATNSTYATGTLSTTTAFRAILTGYSAGCVTATSTTATVTNTGSATATWVTTGTTAWGTASNWSPAVVPAACTNVTIPSGGTQPTVDVIANCNNLTINAGAILTRSTTLNVYGNLTINGSLPTSGFYLNLYGTGNTWGGSSTLSGTAAVNIQNNANYTLTSNQTISHLNNGPLVTNGILNYGSSTLTVSSVWYCTCFNNFNTGMLNLMGGGSVDITKSNYGTGTLWINSSVNNFGFNLDDDYYNVWFSNSAGATRFGSAARDVTVSNNFWIRTGSVDMSASGSNAVKVGGNFTNDASFLASTAVIIMNGNIPQLINGSSITTFNKLLIDNTSTGVTMQQHANSTGANTGSPSSGDPYRNKGGLALETGSLFLNGYTFTSQNPDVAAVTRTSGFLVSELNAATNTSILQWNIGATNGTYIIPFGVSSTYIPFTFTKTAGSSNMQFSTRATAANDNLPWSASVNSMQTYITVYTDGSSPSVIDRWWDITALAGSTSVTANLTFSYRGSENTTSLAPTGTFGAQHWNGTSWDVPVGSGSGVTSGVGTVAVTGANNFSPWVLSSSMAPLPITLLTFTANLNNNNVDLAWATASETNNDFFTIEKSSDGQIFNSIAIVNGAGNSTSTIDYFDIDRNPIVGISYYRLKQTDFDGRTSYSDILSISYNPNGEASISLFPNPSDAGATSYIQLNQMEGEEVLVVLRDIAGRELFSKVIMTSTNNEIVALDPEGKIAKGSYLVTASSANKYYSKNLIVK